MEQLEGLADSVRVQHHELMGHVLAEVVADVDDVHEVIQLLTGEVPPDISWSPTDRQRLDCDGRLLDVPIHLTFNAMKLAILVFLHQLQKLLPFASLKTAVSSSPVCRSAPGGTAVLRSVLSVPPAGPSASGWPFRLTLTSWPMLCGRGR